MSPRAAYRQGKRRKTGRKSRNFAVENNAKTTGEGMPKILPGCGQCLKSTLTDYCGAIVLRSVKPPLFTFHRPHIYANVSVVSEMCVEYAAKTRWAKHVKKHS
jgi:hypothetical protein